MMPRYSGEAEESVKSYKTLVQTYTHTR